MNLKSLGLLALLASSIAACAKLAGADFDGKYLTHGKPPVTTSPSYTFVNDGESDPYPLGGSDPDADGLTYRLIGGSGDGQRTLATSLGTVYLQDPAKGLFTYNPPAEKPVGTTQFQYQVNDGARDAPVPGTVTLTVWPYERNWLGSALKRRLGSQRLGADLDIDGQRLAISTSHERPDPALIVFAEHGNDGEWREARYLELPVDACSDPVFSCSVALSGDWLLVGDGGWQSNSSSIPGKAYFYARDTAGTYHFVQQVSRAVAPGEDEVAIDVFGRRVDLDVNISASEGGPIAVIGSGGDQHDGVGAGAVYAYTLKSECRTWPAPSERDCWVFQQRITPQPESGEAQILDRTMNLFGSRLSLSRDLLAVSAPLAGEGHLGYVYVFRREIVTAASSATSDSSAATQWRQEKRLYPVGEDVVDLRLDDVSAYGNSVLGGGPGGSNGAGAAFFYNTSPGVDGGLVWSETTPLAQFDTPEPNEHFGARVALFESYAAVTSMDAKWLGRVAVYRHKTNGRWEREVVLRNPNNDQTSSLFGASLAMGERTLVVAAPQDGMNGSLSFYNLPTRNAP